MRRRHVPAWTLIAAIGLFVSVSVAAQTPTRDGAKPAAVGTASITGTIVSDDADARPLRRVRVGVMTSDRQVSRTVVTDDEGRFNFVALPTGRYMLTANKQGHVSAAYGARRPNRPGTALVLADGQRITGLTLRMTRGNAISGVLVDHNGEPFSGANVSAMRNTFVGLIHHEGTRCVAMNQ
jgi:Carboxypeptidase regulatory-like domain